MLYERIAEYLEEMGIKQTVVAKKAGMTKQSLSDSLRGVRRLTAEEYIEICRAVNVGTDFFANSRDVDRKAG